MLDFLLDDTIDLDTRIGKGNKAMSALYFIWDTKKIKLDDKINYS